MNTRIIAVLSFAMMALPALASAGVQTYTTSGTFTAPIGATVNIQVIGGGGGGGGGSWDYTPAGGRGGNGSETSVTGSFGTISAPGGAAGAGRSGVGGTGDGGAVVSRTVTMNDGEALTVTIGGGGGGGGGAGIAGGGPVGTNGSSSSGAASGGAGGVGVQNCAWQGSGHSGPAGSGGSGGVSSGGGGGGGAATDDGNYGCISGASGGTGTLAQGGQGGTTRGYANWAKVPAPGGVAPGSGGNGGGFGGGGGGGGGAGQVIISWSVPAPTCSVTFDEDPLTGESTTMHWTSTNATLFYINGVGYVGASGSTAVYAPDNYSGSVSGAGGTGTCSGVLGGANSCVATSRTCGVDGNLHDSCGRATSCQYGCSTVSNQCKSRGLCEAYNACDTTGMKVVNACDDSVIENCSVRGEGWRCVAGACAISAAGFEPFAASRGNQSFTATGHLQPSPILVREGEPVQLYWNVVNASGCTITGDNGDGGAGSPTGVWNTGFSGASGKTTSPIFGRTIFTLHCTSYTGATPPVVDETATVNVLPTFQEQ